MLVDMLHRITTNAAVNKMSTQVYEWVEFDDEDGGGGGGAGAGAGAKRDRTESRHLPISQCALGPEWRVILRRHAQSLQHRHTIGLVGGGGIGNLLNMYQGQAMWSELGCVIVVITFVVWAMDTISAYLREALK
jgi:hypothetical protein